MASLELTLAINGNLKAFTKNYEKAIGTALASVIRGRTTRLKNALRKQVTGAGLGKLAFAVRSETKPPRGPSLTIVGRVFSKAILKNRPGGPVDLITVFDQGATITAAGGKFLALPISTERFGRRRALPADFKDLVFLPMGTSRALLVEKRPGNVIIPRFLLVKQTRISKRLNVSAAYANAIKGLGEATAKAIERELVKRKLDTAA